MPETQLLLLKISIPLVAYGVDKIGELLKPCIKGVSNYLDKTFNDQAAEQEPFSLKFDLLDKGMHFSSIFDQEDKD